MVFKVPFPFQSESGATESVGLFRNATPMNLRLWRKALANQKVGASDANIAFIGDSTTVGLTNLLDGTRGHFRQTSYPVQFASYFSETLTDVDTASVFTVPTGRTNAVNLDYDNRVTLNNWSVAGPNNPDAIFDYGTIYGRMFFNAVDTTLLTFSVASVFDTIDIYYLRGTAFGSFNVLVNGVAVGTTINTAGADGFVKATVTFATTPTAINTVSIQKTVTAEVRIAKVTCRKSDQKRILLNSGGISGGKVADYNSTVPLFTPARPQARARLAEAGLFDNHLYIVNMTINDSTSPATPIADYKASLKNILQSLSSHASVILVTGFPHKRGNATPAALEPYYTANKELSDELSIPLLDIASRWITYDDAASLGFYAFDPVVPSTDNAHPSPQGYTDAGLALSQFLFSVE